MYYFSLRINLSKQICIFSFLLLAGFLLVKVEQKSLRKAKSRAMDLFSSLYF